MYIIVGNKDFLVSNDLYDHLGKISECRRFDRDPACFPIIISISRGYSIKPSKIESLAKSTGLSRKDFIVQLCEDITYYQLDYTNLIHNLVRKHFPEVCPELDISLDPGKTLEEEKSDFAQYFRVIVEYIVIGILQLFDKEFAGKIVPGIRRIFTEQKANIEKIYEDVLILKNNAIYCFIWRVYTHIFIKYFTDENRRICST